MDDRYTRYAAVLTACGIFFYASGDLSLTPQQIADIFKLLDQPKPLEAILKYLDGIDAPTEGEAVWGNLDE